jgi:hypothetical protein
MVAGPRWVPDPRQTGRLTVGHDTTPILSLKITHVGSPHRFTKPEGMLQTCWTWEPRAGVCVATPSSRGGSDVSEVYIYHHHPTPAWLNPLP